jgi:hypothetical protein
LEAFLRLVEQTAHEARGDESVLAWLAADTKSRLAAGMFNAVSDDAITDGIQAAREAGAILATHSSEDEARVVRQWLLQVAYTVARAAREGGILGIGAKDVSDRERDTMADISDALGGPQNQELPDEAATEELPTNADTPQGQTGPDGQPIGSDNIREGRVRGVMGGPNQQQGEGQGG